MSDKVRVAVITEPTAWHRGALIDALHNEEVGEVAVGDVTGGTFDEVREGGAGKVAATYTDLDALYRDFQPQAVLITMEPWRMPPVITQALEAGAHVFHEKPGFVRPGRLPSNLPLGAQSESPPLHRLRVAGLSNRPGSAALDRGGPAG